MESTRSLPEHFDAVIFDVDGTLVDSAASIARAWTTWLQEFGITPDPSVNLNGMTTEAIVRLCLPDADAGELAAAVARIDELEQDAEGVTARPGAAEALAGVPAGRLALATSGTRTIALARLAAAGLTPPAVVVTADDSTRSKPDPEIFRTAAGLLGVRPGCCLVVEDAPAGVQAGRDGGFRVLAVLGTSRRDELLDADLVVDDLSDVCLEPDADGVRLLLCR